MDTSLTNSNLADIPELQTLADWILPQDKLPLSLAISLYSTPIELGGFRLIDKTSRVGVWQDNQGNVIVGFRGTSPNGKDFNRDLKDDWQLATSRASCDLSILENVDIPENNSLTFVGHSLGGAAAMCMGVKYPNSRVVAFNAGAPPTNPVMSGPGPERATHYHVMGDTISSHMSGAAATIIRIQKIGKPTWLSSYPHGVDRLKRDDARWQYVTADDEQASWIAFGKQASSPLIRQIVCKKPIPDTTQRC